MKTANEPLFLIEEPEPAAVKMRHCRYCKLNKPDVGFKRAQARTGLRLYGYKCATCYAASKLSVKDRDAREEARRKDATGPRLSTSSTKKSVTESRVTKNLKRKEGFL